MKNTSKNIKDMKYRTLTKTAYYTLTTHLLHEAQQQYSTYNNNSTTP